MLQIPIGMHHAGTKRTGLVNLSEFTVVGYVLKFCVWKGRLRIKAFKKPPNIKYYKKTSAERNAINCLNLCEVESLH